MTPLRARQAARPDPVTPFDRPAVGLFSGLGALVLGSLAWFGMSWIFTAHSGPLPYAPVVVMAAGVALLGALMAQNLVVDILVGLLRPLAALLRVD